MPSCIGSIFMAILRILSSKTIQDLPSGCAKAMSACVLYEIDSSMKRLPVLFTTMAPLNCVNAMSLMVEGLSVNP